jgi:hypothetical protein
MSLSLNIKSVNITQLTRARPSDFYDKFKGATVGELSHSKAERIINTAYKTPSLTSREAKRREIGWEKMN